MSAAIAYLLFMGPTEVLLPYIVKNRLADGAGDLGLVFAAGGLGSLACAAAVGQLGLPRRTLTFMYLTWTVATLAIAGYGIARSLWGLMLASVLFNTLETAGTIAWATAKQRHVPAELLGRVSSLDWLISIDLVRADGPGSRGRRSESDARRGQRSSAQRPLWERCSCPECGRSSKATPRFHRASSRCRSVGARCPVLRGRRAPNCKTRNVRPWTVAGVFAFAFPGSSSPMVPTPAPPTP